MDRHIARTIVRNSAGDARVIWSIFSGYHPQELRESGGENAKCCECIRQRKSTKRLGRRVTRHTVYNDISAFSRVWIMAGVGGTNVSCQLNFGHFSVVR